MGSVARKRDSPVASEGEEEGRRSRGGFFHPRLVAAVQIGAGLLLFALVAYAVARDWSGVRETLERISPFELLLAELLALSGLGASVLVWRRALRELGSSVRIREASKIYCVGQLGKYLPGSVWAFFVQMELAHRVGVPRSRSMAASIVALSVNLVTGLAVGLLVVPSVAHNEAWRYAAVAVLFLFFAAALSPPVLTRLVDLFMRILRRPALDRPVTWAGMLGASAWSLASWLAYGLSLWTLAVAAGAPALKSLPLCLAGFALAMTAGFIVIVAPSGIGVREAVLVAVLAPVLDTSAALAVALVLRLLFTVADLVAAAASALVRMDISSSSRVEHGIGR